MTLMMSQPLRWRWRSIVASSDAWVTFTSSAPTAAQVALRQPLLVSESGPTHTPSKPVLGGTGVLAPVAGLPVSVSQGPVNYDNNHRLHLTDLKSNTIYDATVAATTQDGVQITAPVHFTTLARRVRITLDSINVLDDACGWLSGCPDVMWTLNLSWNNGSVYRPVAGSTSTCYPSSDVGVPGLVGLCERRTVDNTGIFQPQNNHGRQLTWVFAEENFDVMPAKFTVSGDGDSASWQVPQGVTTASAPLPTTENNGDFVDLLNWKFELFYDAQSYPVSNPNLPTGKPNMPTSPW